MTSRKYEHINTAIISGTRSIMEGLHTIGNSVGFPHPESQPLTQAQKKKILGKMRKIEELTEQIMGMRREDRN